ncbi:MAG: MmcQ/YjbR family DNA-binding protein [Polyangiaceae bacterium]|nr:MmcQ/YjbR family DNA-binding protein [Polyangiaceae bacterium]NUQ74609.1 MmcQ/YjbR family DNA-binding protein [Polyangiaceae bacterium]
MTKTAAAAAARKLVEEIRAFALGMPGAYEDYPWGERVAKVHKKVFVFMGTEEGGKEGFGIGVKLPESNGIALSLPFAEPSGYGLGKSGWVSVKFLPGSLPPAQMLKEWIEESYRAVAPKKLVAELDGGSKALDKMAKSAPKAKKAEIAKPAAAPKKQAVKKAAKRSAKG